jgi:hypothetical protein
MNACPDLLAALRTREQDLMTLAAGNRARLEEVRDLIALIEQPQRRRRRRTEATEPPQHVPGAAHRPQPSSPDELFPDPQDTPESAQ